MPAGPRADGSVTGREQAVIGITPAQYVRWQLLEAAAAEGSDFWKQAPAKTVEAYEAAVADAPGLRPSPAGPAHPRKAES